MANKNVTVVLDAQAGSSGKGKFIGYLAKHDNPSVSICNFMPNASHTYVDKNKKNSDTAAANIYSESVNDYMHWA